MPNLPRGFRIDERPLLSLDPAKTALLLVDLQYHDACRGRGFNLAMERISPGSMEHINGVIEATLIPSVLELISIARATRMQVVYVQYGSDHRDLSDMPLVIRERIQRIEKTSGVENIFWTGGDDFAVLDEIRPWPDDTVFVKRTFGAFSEDSLHAQLWERGIRSLLIGGVSTSCCVESSARGAIDRGYQVVLVADACADYTTEAHWGSLRSFEMNFGHVIRDCASVRELLDMSAQLASKED